MKRAQEEAVAEEDLGDFRTWQAAGRLCISAVVARAGTIAVISLRLLCSSLMLSLRCLKEMT